MKLGICSMDTTKYPTFAALGFDYIEANLASIASMTDEDFIRYRECVKACGLNVEFTNCFFPGGFRVVGNNVNAEKLQAYIRLALSRAGQIGVKGCVFGSGKQRSTDGENYAKIYNDFINVCRLMALEAQPYGIKIIIEPLRYGESDIVNTVQEGIIAAQETGLKNVVPLVDFFHVFCNNEPFDAVLSNGQNLFHAHIARPNEDRKAPFTEEDAQACALWADILKHANYQGCVSLESSLPQEGFDEQLKTTYDIMQVFR